MTGTRQEPLESIGAVDIYAPPASAKSPYYRLRWTNPMGPPTSTSGGRTLDGARSKAQEIADGLSRAASPNAVTELRSMVTAFVDAGRSPYKNGQLWSKSYKKQIRDALARSIEGYEGVRAMDVTQDLLDDMRAQAGTDNMVRQNTSALRALLLWGYRHGDKYFTRTQADLLPERGVQPVPSHSTGATMPVRRARARAVGEHEDFVRHP